jgi:signal transduction histidine kinase/ligand-binding sensor domain-containing protein
MIWPHFWAWWRIASEGIRLGRSLSLKIWYAIWVCCFLSFPFSVTAVILWNEPETILVHENGPGTDILHGAARRDSLANDSLYFRFQVDPLSDRDTEEYLAAFALFEGSAERLGIGNALKAWAYSSFFHGDEQGESKEASTYVDLHSLTPESPVPPGSGSFQYPRRGVGVTIVFKVQYVPGEDDLVTIWLNPDLGPGANESNQPEALTTRFNVNARFDEIRLRHSGGGDGWKFSGLAIATSFSDFVDLSSARATEITAGAFGSMRAFAFQSWLKEKGLPQIPVRALAQSHDGYLWLGGDLGLTRFDGLRFFSYGAQEGVQTMGITALLEDSRGTLWIGGVGGALTRMQDGKFTALDTRELQGKAVTSLGEDGAGRVWIGADSGLFICTNAQALRLPGAESFLNHRISSLCAGPQGEIWVAVASVGVFKFEGERFVPAPSFTEETLLKSARCLLMDGSGRMWLGAGEDSLLCFAESGWKRYTLPPAQAKSPINSLVEESEGTIWAGLASGGLLQFRDGRFLGDSTGRGLAGNVIYALLSDRAGKLWVGTDTALNRLRRQPMLAMGQSDGLGLGSVHGLAEVSPGVVWAAKPSEGLYRYDGKGFSRLSAKGLTAHATQITGLLVSHDGFCWVATTNSLLCYKDPIAAADEVQEIAAAPSGIIALAEAASGGLWAGTRTGELWRLKENLWQAEPDFARQAPITSISDDGEGVTWVATDGSGLFRLQNAGSHSIERIPGIASKSVRTLHLDRAGTLWLGTSEQGLVRCRNGSVVNFTPTQGLPENVAEILEDDQGRLWLGGTGGIACVKKENLEELSTSRIGRIHPRLFGHVEGTPPTQCTTGFFPAGLKSSSGMLWFPAVDGLSLINPRVEPLVTFAPGPVLEDVVLDGAPSPDFHQLQPRAATAAANVRNSGTSLEPLRIAPGKHRVEFRYTAFSYDAPELIRFRYRVEGLDPDWMDAGTQRVAVYNYLPPGNFKFQLAVCDSDGVWREAPPLLEFVVLRHFWQTGSFIVIASLSLMVAVVGAVHGIEKSKLHRRLKRLEQERTLERERTRIAQDLHDEMGAKLCRISFLSEHARRGDLRPEEMQEQISSISAASREVLHSLDEIVWAVNPQNDTLEHVGSYIGQYALDYFQMTGIRCELDIPTQLPSHPLTSQVRHHMFLATHEALTNILKHSGATLARVAMQSHNGSFEINISDNGKGFHYQYAGTTELSSTASGDGLSNMTRRLAQIGGCCRIETEPGKGTMIGLVIPIHPSENGSRSASL